jgi:hypothetical protein
MIWVALSAFIMSITGKGDDTFAFRRALERLRDAVEQQVQDRGRQEKANVAIDRMRAAFLQHRKRVAKIGECLERADRTYRVTSVDYRRCLADMRPAWDAAEKELTAIDRDFRAALTPDEYAAVRRSAWR